MLSSGKNIVYIFSHVLKLFMRLSLNVKIDMLDEILGQLNIQAVA